MKELKSFPRARCPVCRALLMNKSDIDGVAEDRRRPGVGGGGSRPRFSAERLLNNPRIIPVITIN